jgi:hypothetical protein
MDDLGFFAILTLIIITMMASVVVWDVIKGIWEKL